MAGNTLEGLAKAYEDFAVPAAKVLLGGSNLTEDLGARLQKIEVESELREESRAWVVIWDCYDEESHTIASKLKKALIPGSKVEVFLGYQSSFGMVFSGYLDSVRLRLDGQDGYTLCLEAFDVVHLMKENRHRRIFQKDTHSAMFEEVMGSYSWVCKNKTDSTAAIPEWEIRMQECNDYRFVTEELAGPENPGMEFYVKAGTAYFTKKQSNPRDVLTLKPNQGVRELSASWGFLKCRVHVQGFDGEHTVFTASGEAKAGTLDAGAGMSEDFQCFPYLDTQSKVDGWVSAETERRMDEVRQATLTLPGIPVLLAGESISVEEFDSLVNGQYRILKAVHVFDETGYSTEAELGGG